jgi:hypothetical protein
MPREIAAGAVQRGLASPLHEGQDMRTVTCLSLLGLLVAAAPAGAETMGTAIDFDPGMATTVHLQLPASRLLLWIPTDGGFSVLGLSVSQRFVRLVEVEAGFEETVNPCIHGLQWLTRAGVAPSLLRARPEGTHWNLRLPVLFGYHDLSATGGGCDMNPDQHIRALMVTTGLDATYWSRARWGFDVRLLLGIGKGWVREESVADSGRALEAGLTFGVSFR